MTDNRTAVTEGSAFEAAMAQIDRAFGKGRTGEAPALPATMTERVARELCRRDLEIRGWRAEHREREVNSHWRDFIKDAQAVFGAMCEPTEEMLDDVEGWQPKDCYQNLETAREQIEFIWQTMLTTAEYELDPDELARKARQAEKDKAWREAGCPDQGGADCPF